MYFLLLKEFTIYYYRYNFIIGNDGRVYEGRGWNKIGAHTFSYNSCSLGLAFIGKYPLIMCFVTIVIYAMGYNINTHREKLETNSKHSRS